MNDTHAIALDRERIERAARRLERVPGAADAVNATRHVQRHLAAAEQTADGLTAAWAAVEGDTWNPADAATTVATYRAPELPTANWTRGQNLTPMSPDLLEAIRGGNNTQPNMAVTALLDEIDRMAWEIKILQFNYDGAKRNEQAVREHTKSSTASLNATLARVWKLLDHKRKTVAVDALREALQPTHRSAA